MYDIKMFESGNQEKSLAVPSEAGERPVDISEIFLDLALARCIHLAPAWVKISIWDFSWAGMRIRSRVIE
jgi:hypothetical protein